MGKFVTLNIRVFQGTLSTVVILRRCRVVNSGHKRYKTLCSCSKILVLLVEDVPGTRRSSLPPSLVHVVHH